MNPSKKDTILTVVSLYPLIIPILVLLFTLVEEGDWIVFLIAFVISYPLWCFGVCCVRFYDDCFVVFRPLCFFKLTTTIFYDKMEFIKEVTYGKYFATFSPWDLYVYVKGEKRPIGIPMPSSLKKQEELKKLIKSKGIQVEWGIYEGDS